MNRTLAYQIVIVLLTAGCIGLISNQYTEYKQQEERIASVYKIFPVPIPSDLKFAGEQVTLNSFGIRERIDRELLVNTYWQSNTMLILKRSKKYFAIIEPILEKHGIPKDFKYLPIAESGFQNVTSSAGAQGVWQFMPASAKEYGLNINNEVDERMHLELATEAACKYLKNAYDELGSWTLAAAAYNRGLYGIKSALEKQNVDSYYKLHLNSETSRYVMRILAFKIIVENPELYGFNIEAKDYYHEIPTKIHETKEVKDLTVFASSIGSTYHVLKSLNPWIKGNELKERDKPYRLTLPKQ